MPKIIMEFKDEERKEALKAMKTDDMLYALTKVADLRRSIYKGYTNNTIVVNGDKVMSEEDFKKQNEARGTIKDGKYIALDDSNSEHPFKNNKTYIEEQYVLDELSRILDDMWDLLDY